MIAIAAMPHKEHNDCVVSGFITGKSYHMLFRSMHEKCLRCKVVEAGGPSLKACRRFWQRCIALPREGVELETSVRRYFRTTALQQSKSVADRLVGYHHSRTIILGLCRYALFLAHPPCKVPRLRNLMARPVYTGQRGVSTARSLSQRAMEYRGKNIIQRAYAQTNCNLESQCGSSCPNALCRCMSLSDPICVM